MQRADGVARVAFKLSAGQTRLDVLYQSGEAKIRFPLNGPGAPPEAVFINTAGGMTGGDRFQFEVTCAAGTSAVASSQAAERVYRSIEGPVEVRNRLRVDGNAKLAWLPQETILFEESRLDRRLEIDLEPGAELLAAETVIFGRTARGERLRSVQIRDSWRVRQSGQLIYADTFALDGNAEEKLSRRAGAGGAVSAATLFLMRENAGGEIDAVRELLALSPGVEAGASAWNGFLIVRLLSGDAKLLRDVLMTVAIHLSGRPMPRVWRC